MEKPHNRDTTAYKICTKGDLLSDNFSFRLFKYSPFLLNLLLTTFDFDQTRDNHDWMFNIVLNCLSHYLLSLLWRKCLKFKQDVDYHAIYWWLVTKNGHSLTFQTFRHNSDQSLPVKKTRQQNIFVRILIVFSYFLKYRRRRTLKTLKIQQKEKEFQCFPLKLNSAKKSINHMKFMLAHKILSISNYWTLEGVVNEWRRVFKIISILITRKQPPNDFIWERAALPFNEKRVQKGSSREK